MYYPYFRGKQYDLITLRDCAQVLAEAGFIPILEPVKEALTGLMRSVEALTSAGGRLILIVNPSNGHHVRDCGPIHDFMRTPLGKHVNISPAFVLSSETSVAEISDFLTEYHGRELTFIHSGFANAKSLVEYLGDSVKNIRQVFIDGRCSSLYMKHFRDADRILVRDGFERRANREHPPVEIFSDLHVTFDDLGMQGFGDFLIVGDEFSLTGGPAYAVAIHLTCIDGDNDDVMLVHHFKSIRFETPTDPAGKFAEALQKLVDEVNTPGTKILRTPAVEEFFSLHAQGHFPGLGYIKKLSMNHHVQTMAAYFK